MFGKSKTTTKTTTNNENFSANTIQNGTVIEGKINSTGSIRIDGKLTGTITTKAKLVVGKTGVIIGDVFCQNASIEGKIQGKITVNELLHIRGTGIIEGDLITNKLVLEEGAIFNGKSTMGAQTQRGSISGKGSLSHKRAV